MKDHTSGASVIHKDVVVIGNGPSGISISLMLAGNLPYLVSREHPDEMLSARLQSASSQQSLAQQPLGHLAAGLEGRSTNPVSLLLDALEHPCADLGIEMPSLVQWRHHQDKEIDHIVLGKGPPGGSWHTMDPNVLTLSLGSWMALPGCPYSPSSDNIDSQRRASAGSVANYYENYVKQMNLSKYFKNGVSVLSIEKINSTPDTNVFVKGEVSAGKENIDLDQSTKYNKSEVVVKKDCDIEHPRRKCSFVSALNFIRSRTKCNKQKKDQIPCARSCKRPRDFTKNDMSPNRKVREIIDKSYFLTNDVSEQSVILSRRSRDNLANVDITDEVIEKSLKITDDSLDSRFSRKSKFRSLSFSCDSDFNAKTCDNKLSNNNQKHNSLINISDCNCSDVVKMDILCECTELKDSVSENIPNNARWLIYAYDHSTGCSITYSCHNLVLANGASDLPNRLGLSAEAYDLPWVLHDLRSLEDKLDNFKQPVDCCPDPVLVVGAGLSAADAVIATRFRNIPVLHVFRNRSASLDKQLPENMYPEYHKVHQMMQDGGSTYPLYTALPEHIVSDISATNQTVTLVSKSGLQTEYKVSFVVILIGSRPDLQFLPKECSLGVNKSAAIDAKSNPINIDTMTHSVLGHEGLYALGPLAGDNFVRFIPGGALAVVSDLYKNKNW